MLILGAKEESSKTLDKSDVMKLHSEIRRGFSSFSSPGVILFIYLFILACFVSLNKFIASH